MPMNRLFRNPQPVITRRGVHLDLKGCPPTPQRLLSLLRVISAARYNVILVEWEDTFPWTLDERFRNASAYTPEQVRTFCRAAADVGIELIPVVTCMGHLETPLSLPEYAHLREVPHRADVLNPLAPGARELIERMVDDVLELMPDVRHFHLGGDEAWTFGTHPDTRAYVEQHGKGALYLHHVEPILDKLNASGVRPILWHDMMVEWSPDALRRLSGKADLMFWTYGEHPDQQHWPKFTTKDRLHLASHGVRLWGAGCYKGADGHNVDLPNLEKRQANALGWAEVAQRENLIGVVATAWSRYSTHRVQNEPIDAALDSLVNVGVILHDGRAPDDGIESCIAALGDLGERERFEKCNAAMRKLTDVRKRGWSAVQSLREQLVLSETDPRRRGSGMELHGLRDLKRVLSDAAEVESQVRIAFDGLLDRIWIEQYLVERLQPLREEAAELQPRAVRLDPSGATAEGLA